MRSFLPESLRITPAGAGKTRARNTCKKGKRGSPPQVRGKPGFSFPLFDVLRITPAGAGKTIRPCERQAAEQDHPRRCGENVNRFSADFKNIGSPPQVRGKLAITAPDELGNGITPAGAGKTLSVRLTPFAFQDHPRRCGENFGIFLSL